MEVGEHRRQGVGAVQIGAAVCADDLHAGVLAEAQEMSQQQQSRLGCPMKVVENQNDGRARGGDAEQRNDSVEECIAFGVRVSARRCGKIGQHIGQPGNQWKQRFNAAQPTQSAGFRGRA